MHDLTRSNWLGLWTLYLREVRRFAKVYNQTLFAPVEGCGVKPAKPEKEKEKEKEKE